VCRVTDWEWDYYVKNHGFVDVIDEYAKLKSSVAVNGAKQSGGSQPAATPAAMPGTKQAQTPAQPDAPLSNAGNAPNDPNGANVAASQDMANAQTSTDRPNAANVQNVENGQNIETSVTKAIQTGLLQKILGNIIPIGIGCLLTLAFVGIKKWNESHRFMSDEKSEPEN
jgi:hypothetical protein